MSQLPPSLTSRKKGERDLDKQLSPPSALKATRKSEVVKLALIGTEFVESKIPQLLHSTIRRTSESSSR